MLNLCQYPIGFFVPKTFMCFWAAPPFQAFAKKRMDSTPFFLILAISNSMATQRENRA
jgi:hypothetical protein